MQKKILFLLTVSLLQIIKWESIQTVFFESLFYGKERADSEVWLIHKWLAWFSHRNNICRKSISHVSQSLPEMHVCFCDFLFWNSSFSTLSSSPSTENQKGRQQFWPGLHPRGAGAHPGGRRHYQADQPGWVQGLLLLRRRDPVLILKPPSPSPALYLAHTCAANAVNAHELIVDHHLPRIWCFNLKVKS